MLSKSIVFAGLAASAAANYILPRDIEVRAQHEARQEGGAECASAILEVFGSIPTPPPEVVSFAATNTVTDACAITFPAEVAPIFSSYGEEVLSWYSDNADEFSSALSQCPQISEIATSLEQLTCSTGAPAPGPSASSAPAETTPAPSSVSALPSASSNGTVSLPGPSSALSSSLSTAGVPRATGLVGAAIGAAGFLGIVAAL